MTPYYQHEWITLYHGDCRAIAPQLAADLVIADPPYGDTSLEWDVWPEGWIDTMPAMQIWCFGSMRMHLLHAPEFRAWNLAQDIIWEKHNGSSMLADRFRRVHEIAVHRYRGAWGDIYHETPMTRGVATKRSIARNGKPIHFGGIGDSNYASETGGDLITRSVIYARSEHHHAIHPTQKPTAILRPIIEYSCAPGGIVLDPFAGSGSTLIAARAVGRQAIGIELSEQYCEAIVKRLEEDSPLFQEAGC